MPRISEMPPSSALTGLELIPALQGGGDAANVGIPLLAYSPEFGGAVLALRVPIEADLSSTDPAAPGPGRIRWNNADVHLATELYVSDVDAGTGDLVTLFATLAVGGFVYLQGGADSESRNNLQRWQVTSIVVEPGFTRLGVALQASGGTFAEDDALELSIQQPAPSPGVDRNVVTAVSSSSGTTTLNAAAGDYFTTTLTEDTTLAVINVPQACTLSLRITQDAATARTMQWPASFRWPNGHNRDISAGLGANDRLVMTTDNYGASWDCAIGKGHTP